MEHGACLNGASEGFPLNRDDRVETWMDEATNNGSSMKKTVTSRRPARARRRTDERPLSIKAGATPRTIPHRFLSRCENPLTHVLR